MKTKRQVQGSEGLNCSEADNNYSHYSPYTQCGRHKSWKRFNRSPTRVR